MITWPEFERGACILLGTVHFLLGFATWVGGADRFPSPGYTPLLELTNGLAWPYGILWMLGGLIMVFVRSTFRLVGIAFIVIVSNLWAAMFCLAALREPFAPLTPIVAYGGYGLMNAVLAALIVMHRGWENGEG